jgi:hypothetical protein
VAQEPVSLVFQKFRKIYFEPELKEHVCHESALQFYQSAIYIPLKKFNQKKLQKQKKT